MPALFGIDPHQATLELALSQHIVDYADCDPAKLLPDADLVILAAPVPTILTLLEQLPSVHFQSLYCDGSRFIQTIDRRSHVAFA